MTPTLEAVEAKQAEITAMIEAIRKAAAREYKVAGGTIQLNPGEQYAGFILGKDGEPDHHLILLPGDEAELNRDDAKQWAKEQGGELPTRREQSLLYANLKDEFQGTWYWSGEARERESGWAWCQGFGYGGQSGISRDDELRARAVRRLILL